MAKIECIFEMGMWTPLEYHLFCWWRYILSVIEIILDEISPESSNFLTTFSELRPPWCNFAREKLKTRRIALSNGDNPLQTYISTEEHGSVFIENRVVVPVGQPTGTTMNYSEWIFFSFIAKINGEIIYYWKFHQLCATPFNKYLRRGTGIPLIWSRSLSMLIAWEITGNFLRSNTVL